MTSENELAALRALAVSKPPLGPLRRDQIAAARAAGASWDEVAAALGVSTQRVVEYYCADIWRRLEANAARNADISDDEAMEIAVAEVRAVRQELHVT